MYIFFNIEEPDKYANGFLDTISQFGSLSYDKNEMMILFEPSIIDPDDRKRIYNDLFTPGEILYRYYDHGQRHIDYRDRYLTSTSDVYAQKKLLQQKIDEYYGL
ncbi:MAG: hypothetical protein U1D64_03490 [Bacteroidales bacterium]|nr:hypothetical protein [Bacteroidales bacterium]